MVKILIILYLIVMAVMILMIPVKLFTSRQLRCPRCGGPVLAAKRKKELNCPHCGNSFKTP